MENDGLRAITNSLYPVRHSATAMAPAASENRAIAYVRVSTSRQADEGNSIASQFERVREYARFRRLKLLSRDIIIDDGVSGGIPLFDRGGSVNPYLTRIWRDHDLQLHSFSGFKPNTAPNAITCQMLSRPKLDRILGMASKSQPYHTMF